MHGWRVIAEKEIAGAVEELSSRASVDLPGDVEEALRRSLEAETSSDARYALEMILENARVARAEGLPLCPDTGMFHLFVEVGEGACLPHRWREAADRGMAAATARVPLRSSLVDDPLFSRQDRGDNTPILIHPGDGGPAGGARLTLLAKGGGSENAACLRMLLPGEGAEGLKRAVLAAVREKAPAACPPVVVSVGVGSDAAGAMDLGLRGLLRPLGERNPRWALAELEEELLAAVNATGIGAAGLGGGVTALDVHVEEAPAHIACLPVGIVICCHSLRRRGKEV